MKRAENFAIIKHNFFKSNKEPVPRGKQHFPSIKNLPQKSFLQQQISKVEQKVEVETFLNGNFLVSHKHCDA